MPRADGGSPPALETGRGAAYEALRDEVLTAPAGTWSRACRQVARAGVAAWLGEALAPAATPGGESPRGPTTARAPPASQPLVAVLASMLLGRFHAPQPTEVSP